MGGVETLFNPSGFIEQRYIGPQTVESVQGGREELVHSLKELTRLKKPPLLLVDLTEMGERSGDINGLGVKAMRETSFKKIAFYGPIKYQVLINTLAMVADKHRSIRAFSGRSEAIKWLRYKEKS